MTTQTKHYVDPSDVIAMRGECRRCSATVSIPLVSRPIRLDGLHSCPNCNEPWAQWGQQSIEPSVRNFIEGFIALQEALGRLDVVEGKDGGGFRFSLELKHEAAVSISSASGRASRERD